MPHSPTSDDELQQKMADLQAELAARGVSVQSKADVWHQRLIHQLLRLVTLGSQSAYLDRYVTTLGNHIYVTPDWAQRSLGDRWVTLCHELVHVDQFARYGFVPMALAYLLLPLPMGLAWCRMRLEREAYAESVRATYELGGLPAAKALREHVVSQFVSGSYGWMWPFPSAMERWFDALIADLERRAL